MAEPTATITFVVMPAIVSGLVIGIYEAILLHRDVTIPTHRLGHTVHALVFAVIFTFVSMNTQWVATTFNLASIHYLLANKWVLRAVVGLIAVAKIHGASAAIRGSGTNAIGLKETWAHSLLIGILIIVAPEIWPLLAGSLPGWMQK